MFKLYGFNQSNCSQHDIRQTTPNSGYKTEEAGTKSIRKNFKSKYYEKIIQEKHKIKTCDSWILSSELSIRKILILPQYHLNYMNYLLHP